MSRKTHVLLLYINKQNMCVMCSIYRGFTHKMVKSYVISDAGSAVSFECRLLKSKRSKDNNVVCRRHESDRLLLLFRCLVLFTHSKSTVCAYELNPNRVRVCACVFILRM